MKHNVVIQIRTRIQLFFVYVSLFSLLVAVPLVAGGTYTEGELDTAARYFKGELKTTPFAREFRASEEEDVPAIKELSEARRLELMTIALRSLAANEGVISILAAGASTRMNPSEAPPDVKEILGHKDIKAKASVPLGVIDGKVYTYMGAFLTNIDRLQEEASSASGKKLALRVLVLSNQDYRPELQSELDDHNYYGLAKDQLLIFNQELGNQMIATPADAEATRTKLNSPEPIKHESVELSKKAQHAFLTENNRNALMLENEKVPLGHGEFFHQMISSGTFLRLYNEGRKWISVRNIDNSAATYDENWLVTLGLFLARELDMQPEVSPRTAGQKGGSLIISGENHILAEDPQIAVSKDKNLHPDRGSYWFNDAVAIFSMNYVMDMYKLPHQSNQEFIEELRAANPLKLAEIAARGRAKFPVLMDPKPAKTSNAIAMKVETNMWQSTGVVSPEVKVKAVGVEGIFNVKESFERSGVTPQERAAIVKDLRFLATKQWKGPSESYESNKAYIEYMLRHITKGRLFPEGLRLK